MLYHTSYFSEYQAFSVVSVRDLELFLVAAPMRSLRLVALRIAWTAKVRMVVRHGRSCDDIRFL